VEHRHHDFVRRWFLPAGSGSPDVVTMLIDANTLSGSNCRYNLKKGSQVMKIRSHVYASHLQWAWKSNTTSIRLRVDHAVLRDAVLTAIKEKCDTCRKDAPRQGVAARTTAAAGVSEGGLSNTRQRQTYLHGRQL
jgi:hypothetical protein